MENIDIDKDFERKLKRMKYRIIEAEKENIVSKKKKKDEMVDSLRKIIEEEIRKCY